MELPKETTSAEGCRSEKRSRHPTIFGIGLGKDRGTRLGKDRGTRPADLIKTGLQGLDVELKEVCEIGLGTIAKGSGIRGRRRKAHAEGEYDRRCFVEIKGFGGSHP